MSWQPVSEHPDDRYWALDIADGWPWRAHLIVGKERDIYLTACGARLGDSYTGCWGTNGEALPLQPQHVHCGMS